MQVVYGAQTVKIDGKNSFIPHIVFYIEGDVITWSADIVFKDEESTGTFLEMAREVLSCDAAKTAKASWRY